MKILFRVRVVWKLLLRRFIVVDSFCKLCGVDVRDFAAPDDVWKQINPQIKHGHVVCYNCFCDLCAEVGLTTMWCLTTPRTPIYILHGTEIGTGLGIAEALEREKKVADGIGSEFDVLSAGDALHKKAQDWLDRKHEELDKMSELEMRRSYLADRAASKE